MSEKNRECPACKAVGHDKKGDHLFLMRDGETWACLRPYHEPYYEKDGEPCASPGEDHLTERGDIVADLGVKAIRGIPRDVVYKYGVKVECSTADGSVIKHYYPITQSRGAEVLGYKIRVVEDKTFWTIGTHRGAKVDFFGMKANPFHPETLLITAGELDAMAAYTMMQKLEMGTRLGCVSLPFGDTNLQSFIDNKDWLDEIPEIIFCPDQDDPGLKVVEKIALLRPGIKIAASMSEKDACDMLKAGKLAEFRDAILHAKPWRPSSIVTVGAIRDKALEKIQPGLSYPFDKLTRMTYGLRTRSIIAIGAGPGTGKTSFTKSLQTHTVKEHKKKIGIIGLEETPDQILRSLGGHIIGKPVHLPDCVYDEDELADAIDSLDGLVYIYDHRGYRDWKDITTMMTYMIYEGVEVFFIDPLSALVAHLNASDANTYLNTAMFDLSKLVQSSPVSIFHVNHLNNPTTGRDHGAGGRVYGSQFSGSRAMWKFSTDVWGLERNQLADTEEERNTTRLVIIKQRLAGLTGEMYLRWDKDKGVLYEVTIEGGFKDLTGESY